MIDPEKQEDIINQDTAENSEEIIEKEEKKTSLPIKILQSYWHIPILLLLLFLYYLQAANFINNHNAPQYADANNHLLLARQYHRALFEKSMTLEHAPLHQVYPPMIYAVAALFMEILGVSVKSALWSFFLYIIVYCIALYGIGSYFGKQAGGVAAALLGISCHYTIYISNIFVAELAQTAFTAMALNYLLRSEKFTNEKNTWLFGIFLGLAMLSKWSTAFFMVIPLLMVLVYIIYRDIRLAGLSAAYTVFFGIAGYVFLRTGFEMIGKRPGGNAPNPPWLLPVFLLVTLSAFASTYLIKTKFIGSLKESARPYGNYLLTGIRGLLIALLVCGPWYVYSIQGVAGKLISQKGEISRPHYNERTKPLFIKSLKFYASEYKLYPNIYYIFFFAGIIALILKREKLFEFAMLFAMGIGGIILISPLSTPAVFYIASVFILLAVMSGYWLGYCGKFAFGLMPIVIFFSFLSLVQPMWEPVRNFISHNYYHYNRRWLGYYEHIRPDNYNYGLDRIVEDLAARKEEAVRGRVFPGIGEGGIVKIPLGVDVADDFQRYHGKQKGRIERPVFNTLLYYNKIYDFRVFYNEHQEWNRHFNQSEKIPVFVICGYIDSDYLDEMRAAIHRRFKRETKIINIYEIDEQRKIALIEVPVAITPDYRPEF